MGGELHTHLAVIEEETHCGNNAAQPTATTDRKDGRNKKWGCVMREADSSRRTQKGHPLSDRPNPKQFFCLGLTVRDETAYTIHHPPPL